MTQRIIKTGNSSALTIPREFMEALNLEVGDEARAVLDFENLSVTYKFPEARQLPLRQRPPRPSAVRQAHSGEHSRTTGSGLRPRKNKK
ncbi:AbrB/MazE/SpoVT family DNA-binding domain-containing protein [Candidatus Parcubacteria bacterium]|nr:AbrB/MazE/SpoVT family DNA-binding domain-containing protein [Candidatus Parcubacteria bacterium]